MDILERLGKFKEARELLRNSVWFRCKNLYYKPSAEIILDSDKKIKGKLDTKNCHQVPFSHVDALEAKLGIRNMPTVSNPQPTKGGCCR